MAIVLAATGIFIYLQLRADLDHTIDQGLRSRAGDISALVQQADTGLRDATTRPARGPVAEFAQIIDAGTGRVFDATPGLRDQPLLTGAALRAAQHASTPTLLDRSHIPATDTPIRLLATPVNAQGRHLVIVVGAALEDRDQALADLGTLLVTGGLAALLLASLAGYGLATAALRPVEAMRRRAASITTHQLEQRLPLGPRHDELHRLGQTLNDMLARLQAGLERERAFTADASHELRTPLTLLKTELELIARDHPTGPDLDHAARAAVDEADRLARLIDDLLVLARSDSDQLALDRQHISVAELLTTVRARYAHAARDVEIQVHAPPELTVHGDAALLRQALTNMLDNALRHGLEPILLYASADNDRVGLHVEDHGPGLPPAFLAHAFERFARAHPTRSPDGAGLGLAIVNAIAQSHRGTAHITNRPDGGTHVWITVPTGRTHAPAKRASSDPDSAAIGAS
jgi:two-component system OmpR family sensor kinase